MQTVHCQRGWSCGEPQEFDALVEDLVGAHEKDQLLAVLGPMKADIVEKQ